MVSINGVDSNAEHRGSVDGGKYKNLIGNENMLLQTNQFRIFKKRGLEKEENKSSSVVSCRRDILICYIH